MVKRDNSEQFEQMLSDYRNSGMTSNAWCLSKGIKKSTLYYWMKRLKAKSSKTDINTKWAELSFPAHALTPSSSCITLKIGKFSLDIQSGFEKSALENVLEVVMQLC